MHRASIARRPAPAHPPPPAAPGPRRLHRIRDLSPPTFPPRGRPIGHGGRWREERGCARRRTNGALVRRQRSPLRGLTRRRRGRAAWRRRARGGARARRAGAGRRRRAARARRSSPATASRPATRRRPTLDAWLASPYRAVGIYIGGVNRTCANTELTPTGSRRRVATRLEPDPDLRRPAGAVRRAGARSRTSRRDRREPGHGGGRRRDRPRDRARPRRREPDLLRHGGLRAQERRRARRRCRRSSRRWVNELHAHGYVAGVYGSAASTIRDMQALAGTPRLPTTSGSRTGTAARASSATRTSATRSGRATSGSTSTAAGITRPGAASRSTSTTTTSTAAVVGAGERRRRCRRRRSAPPAPARRRPAR